ncbi:dienelactone hydrolase family protein [Gordonia sp. NPDC003585]|uniref:dienelactone hydrolase family protein n=1 Tax=unclassified Gordonia (in: high G+C Gram-positive bacteria) TaxID=2657482 RepID=UPI0033AECC14
MPGENIVIAAADGDAEAYVARPDDDGPHPGVLFLTDAIGLRPHTRAMADRIASWGYVVLAPNVFYRNGTAEEVAPAYDLLLPEDRAAFMKVAMGRVRTLTDDVVIPDLTRYLDALAALPDVSGSHIGVTGYCMGGRLALLAARTRPEQVAAVGMFHTGRLVTEDSSSPHLHMAGIDAFVLAIHADNDRSLPATAVAQFEHALISSGVTHHATVYPGAAHGYTMADTADYHHAAAEHHYDELEALFARTLTPHH